MLFNHRKRGFAWLVMPVFLALATLAGANDDLKISEPSALDRYYMSQQREMLDSVTRGKYGRQFKGEKDYDLALLQRLLDDKVFENTQKRELQAMGVIMGDLLAEDLGMHWVIYEDRAGRSRALRYKDSDAYLFPITMISRRREVDNREPVVDIYQRAYDIIDPLRTPMPFQ